MLSFMNIRAWQNLPGLVNRCVSMLGILSTVSSTAGSLGDQSRKHTKVEPPSKTCYTENLPRRPLEGLLPVAGAWNGCPPPVLLPALLPVLRKRIKPSESQGIFSSHPEQNPFQGMLSHSACTCCDM